MKKIAFIISHRPDNRYLKRINILKNHYDLHMIFWNKCNELIHPTINGVVIRELHIPANQTNPLKRLPETWKFIRRAYEELGKTEADIVYVGNLDMLYIARKYKHKVNPKTKIIYEIADLHRLIIDRQTGVNLLLSSSLKKMERKYIKDVDILVLTSMKFYDAYYYGLVDKAKVVFLPNMPEKSTFEGYVPKDRNGEQFTIGFIGWIRYKSQLKRLIDAAGKTGCRVLFAGSDGEGSDFEEYCKQFQYVDYLGAFNYEEKIRDLYDLVDCVYAVYDADWTNVRIALPNKLYEAIECEKPIIVAKTTYLGELVEQYGVGLQISHKDTNELVNAILKLKGDHIFYNKLVNNAKKAKKTVTLNSYNQALVEKIRNLI